MRRLKNTNDPRQWPLWGEITDDRWTPHTKGQRRGKCFHLMTSSLSSNCVSEGHTTLQQSHGLYSLSSRPSYRQISLSLEAASLNVTMIPSLCNLTSISTAALLRCLSNCRAIGKVRTRISRLRDFTRSWCKTSVYGVNRDPDVHSSHQPVTSSSRIPFTMVIIHSRF